MIDHRQREYRSGVEEGGVEGERVGGQREIIGDSKRWWEWDSRDEASVHRGGE